MSNTDEDKLDEIQGVREASTGLLNQFYSTVFKNKAAAWTACFTMVLAVFSILLWQANNDANQTSIQTQRAFLNYAGIQIAKDTQGDSDKILKGVRIIVNWANSGTTPTKTSVTQANVAITPDTSQAANFNDLPQSERRRIVIGPKAITQSIPVPISLADLESVKSGTEHAYAWGWTAYYDIFPGTPMRLSEYCTELDNPVWTKKVHTDAAGDMRFDTPTCPVHNCYDENCSDYRAKVDQLSQFIQ